MTYYLALASFVFFGVSALAEPFQASVAFAPKELEAISTLLRPELTALEIDGRSGVVTPAPSFKYLGMEQSHFDINMKGIADIIDLHFNHLRNKPFQFKFSEQGLQVTVPVADQNKGVACSVGAISFKDVALVGTLVMKTYPSGDQALVLKDVQVTGQLSGTGVLKSKFILKKTREALVSVLSKELNKLIAPEKIQEAIKSGLLTWSKFYSGNDYKSLVPGSIGIDAQGIHYQVQE